MDFDLKQLLKFHLPKALCSHCYAILDDKDMSAIEDKLWHYFFQDYRDIVFSLNDKYGPLDELTGELRAKRKDEFFSLVVSLEEPYRCPVCGFGGFLWGYLEDGDWLRISDNFEKFKKLYL